MEVAPTATSSSAQDCPARLPIGGAQPMDRLAVKLATLESDQVQPCQRGAIAYGHAIGNDVTIDHGMGADKGMRPDAGKLMDYTGATENHIVADLAVARYADIIGHDDIVADDRIMSHMGTGHDQAVIAEPGFHAATFGARIDRYRLPDDATLTDHNPRGFTVIFTVLRFVADGGKGKNAGAGTEFRVAIDRDMGEQFHIVVQHDIVAHYAIGADLHPLAELRARTDNGRRMNDGSAHESASTIIATASSDT